MLVKLDQLNMRGILSVTAWSSAGENSTFEIAYVLAPGWSNIVLKYEILSILLILLFHQQFVIMAAATVVIAPVQTHACVLHFGLDLPVT